ncbi:MAG: endonuclease/exonuclease/phosphatase family protein [bacterium]
MQQHTLNAVTLNVGRGFPGIEKTLGFFHGQAADVLLLQDLRADHIGAFLVIFGPSAHFVPMCYHFFRGGIGWVPVGVGIFSRHPLINVSAYAYVGAVQPVQNLDGYAHDAQGASFATDLDRLRKTESRLAVFADVVVPGCVPVRFGTTHGVWTPGGKADDHQRKAMRILRSIMEERMMDGAVMAGDFNAAAGGEIHQMLTGSSVYNYRMPHGITNTVDWVKRGRSGPHLVVDQIYAAHLDIAGVDVHSGVSDNLALTFTVQLRPDH